MSLMEATMAANYFVWFAYGDLDFTFTAEAQCPGYRILCRDAFLKHFKYFHPYPFTICLVSTLPIILYSHPWSSVSVCLSAFSMINFLLVLGMSDMFKYEFHISQMLSDLLRAPAKQNQSFWCDSVILPRCSLGTTYSTIVVDG